MQITIKQGDKKAIISMQTNAYNFPEHAKDILTFTHEYNELTEEHEIVIHIAGESGEEKPSSKVTATAILNNKE